MSWFSELFSGGDERRLKQGMKAANSGQPEMAIQQYDAILATTNDADLRTRCLLNRALAYSAMGDISRAEWDLKSVLSEASTAGTVQAIAREKLARIRKRSDRAKERIESVRLQERHPEEAPSDHEERRDS